MVLVFAVTVGVCVFFFAIVDGGGDDGDGGDGGFCGLVIVLPVLRLVLVL